MGYRLEQNSRTRVSLFPVTLKILDVFELVRPHSVDTAGNVKSRIAITEILHIKSKYTHLPTLKQRPCLDRCFFLYWFLVYWWNRKRTGHNSSSRGKSRSQTTLRKQNKENNIWKNIKKMYHNMKTKEVNENERSCHRFRTEYQIQQNNKKLQKWEDVHFFTYF